MKTGVREGVKNRNDLLCGRRAQYPELLVYTLGTTGFEAKGLSDGKELKKALKEEIPELILLDIMLPGEDGYSILEKLKQDPETSEIPIIMVTGKRSGIRQSKRSGGRR